jgi:hypothetical protein
LFAGRPSAQTNAMIMVLGKRARRCRSHRDLSKYGLRPCIMAPVRLSLITQNKDKPTEPEQFTPLIFSSGPR